MLNAIVAGSLRLRWVTLCLALAMLVVGIRVALNAPLDIFPEFAPPQVIIQTEAPGLPAEEVEQLVTAQIESALAGVPGLVNLRSVTSAGLSDLTAYFDDGTDLFRARQVVAERLGPEAVSLPAGVAPPAVLPMTSSTDRILMLGLVSKTRTLMELHTLARWTLQRRLAAVPGVSSVLIYGGEPKQYQVVFSPEKMQSLDVGLDEVVKAAQGAAALSGAGYIDTPSQRLPIRVLGPVESLEDLSSTPLALRGRRPLTLGQVADVRLGSAVKVGDASINGRQGVLIAVNKLYGFNTLDLTLEVEKAVSEVRKALPADVELVSPLFRPATFIDQAIASLRSAMGWGCLLVALILGAFLFEWRTAVISLTAIPLSLFGAVLVLRALGESINTMTLGGLAIAIGEVVDDAIIDVENIHRRLALNAAREHREPAFLVVLEASLEVRSAVVYASFVVSLVFLPVFFLPGVAGKIFTPLGHAYILAILASLAVALTVTPAMSLLLLPHSKAPEASPLSKSLRAVYGRVLPWFLDRRWSVIALAAAMVLSAAAAIPFLGGEFLPDFREPSFIIHMAGSPSSSLDESLRIGSSVGSRLLEVPGALSVAQQLGRTGLSEDAWGTDYSEVYVALDTRKIDYATQLREVRRVLSETPGIVSLVKQFLKERIEEIVSGVNSQIAVQLFGPDLEQLEKAARQVSEAIKKVPGISDLQVEQLKRSPQLDIRVRRSAAALYGLTPGRVLEDVQTAFFGKQVGQVYEGDRFFDIVVQGPDELRGDPEAVGRLLLDTASGVRVPLSAVADVSVVGAPGIIYHSSGRRRLIVGANVAGRDVASVAEDIKRTVESLKLPPGCYASFAGEYEESQAARRTLVGLSLLALLGITLLLYLDFRSMKKTLMVLLSVPLALIGGVLAAAFTGGSLSLGSLVGFVTLFGIAVRNGIMLISHYRHLSETEGLPHGRELIVKGAEERLVPILMTALAAGLGLAPLAFGAHKPGQEVEYPMAVVILGGLVTSTLLNLLLLPLLYERWGAPAKPGH